MWTLYESILSLCEENGITGGKMCVDLGLSKSLMTDLKSGRKKSINSNTAQKIADYFGVLVDRVVGGPEQNEKAPDRQDEGLKDMPDIRMIARAGKKMTPEQRENARKMLQYLYPEAFEDDDA